MLPEKKKLPVGTEFFDKLRNNDYYYVDKTGLIAELLRNPSDVTLFTRPRRFGKTLAMTTLKNFFEIGADPSLFDGLRISRERELCEKHMGKYPVVFLTFKDAEGSNFEYARRLLAARVSVEASRFEILADSPNLSEGEKELFARLLNRDMSLETLGSSLWDLSRLLEKHYKKKVILLIDEYDVPLQKAFYAGYYDEMAGLIRGMFSQALKSNDSLAFAVLTGCLRISRESIFTGMNNLSVMTVSHKEFSDCFGFTDAEVREMMDYYGVGVRYETVREWYDGYRFGDTKIYCPWDVVNYVRRLLTDPGAEPENFWANSSGNDAVREFVRRMDTGPAKRELEEVVAGETVAKRIREELTYREMYNTADNLWSLLYMTGYLTARDRAGDRLMLTVPNMEIRNIFKDEIMDLINEDAEKDGETVSLFAEALLRGDAEKAQEVLEKFLRRTVSIRDTFVKRELQENFYHGILLGILGFKDGWYVTSNFETGDGYGDILVRTDDEDTGIVIEVKYVRDGDLESGARQALRQIEEKRYYEALTEEGYSKILKYGVACCKKRCRVELAGSNRPDDIAE